MSVSVYRFKIIFYRILRSSMTFFRYPRHYQHMHFLSFFSTFFLKHFSHPPCWILNEKIPTVFFFIFLRFRKSRTKCIEHVRITMALFSEILIFFSFLFSSELLFGCDLIAFDTNSIEYRHVTSYWKCKPFQNVNVDCYFRGYFTQNEIYHEYFTII